MKRYVVPAAVAAVFAFSGAAFAQCGGYKADQTAEVPPVEKPAEQPST
jgi:hypothetical protein